MTMRRDPLCKEANLAKCAKKIMSWGSKFAIIKKGENGAILFTKEGLVFPASAFFLDEIVDPTGASVTRLQVAFSVTLLARA